MDRFSAALWWVAAIVMFFHPTSTRTEQALAMLLMFFAIAEFQRADRRAKRDHTAREERGA